MTLLALDLNATRTRAAVGATPGEVRPLLFDKQPELPMAVSLEGKRAEVGRPGTALCRRSPHLACINFLPSLGEQQEWSGPRVQINAEKALGLVFEQVYAHSGKHRAAAAAVPGYLDIEQVARLTRVADKYKLKLNGTLDVALAATLAAHARQPWKGVALFADVDDHALTWAAVTADATTARVLHTQSHPQLSLTAWKDRLLAAVADLFIRTSRRDPRDSAEAEQMLHDQLDVVLAACASGQQAEVAVRSPQWYQNLVLGPQDLAAACTQLRDRTMAAFNALCSAAAGHGSPHAVIMTPPAGRLPGLASAVDSYLADLAVPQEQAADEDFGEFLLQEVDTPPHLQVLGADAVCAATAALADRLGGGALTPGHQDAVPLPEPRPPNEGEPRLHFRGQEYPLRTARFTLGRDPRNDLAFDSTEFPSISGNHCEIACDQRGFTLIDSSRYGTLVNNRPVHKQRPLQPGDWIRLSSGGPLLRFLGALVK